MFFASLCIADESMTKTTAQAFFGCSKYQLTLYLSLPLSGLLTFLFLDELELQVVPLIVACCGWVTAEVVLTEKELEPAVEPPAVDELNNMLLPL